MNLSFIKEQRYWFIKIAESFLGKWYIYGGDDPDGFDCSGMVIEGLKSVGEIKLHEDASADDLWKKYQARQISQPEAGDLAFWFTEERATHVAVCISPFFCITADGGGSATLTLEDARKQNAFIKIRHIWHRKNNPKFVNVFKE